MQRTRNILFAGILLVTGTLGLARCKAPGQNPDNTATDTSPMVSAPDNNSANNPSLADTAYEKNRTPPITDTLKPRDTSRHRR
ncbi:MAG TPA: hypothetical protein VGQ51_04000 [Puia sp.]|jgi:hypothetical protein|nr:hypothetical protein [Puia sp.]